MKFINKNRLLFLFLIVSALSSLLFGVKREDLIKPYIFVDSESEIPDSLRQREEYFYVLLDYEKALYKGYVGYLQLLYGQPLDWGYRGREIRTESIKTNFEMQAEIIETAGTSIWIYKNFTKPELFDYQNMIERHWETFEELFDE